MKYNKIRGRSVSECVMQLRSNFGSDAIILESREVSEGGLLGSGLFSRKRYEVEYMLPESRVSAASSTSLPFTQEVNQEAKGKKFSPLVSQAKSSLLPLHSTLRAIMEEKSRASYRKPKKYENYKGQGAAHTILEEADKASKAQFSKVSSTAVERKAYTSDKALAPLFSSFSKAALEGADGKEERKEAEIYSARSKLAAEPFPELGDAPVSAAANASILRVAEQLSAAQLSPIFTNDFLRQLENSLSPRERSEHHIVEQKSLKLLSEIIRVQPSQAPLSGECRAFMFIGPTGSGKTMSLAKLASRFHYVEKRAISIYSLDHRRLAATEQLKTYAEVMEIKNFSAPLRKEDFAESLRRDGAEIILVDSTGISHSDEEGLGDIKSYLEICKQEVKLETNLVLAANINPALLGDILRAYQSIGFDKILLTKLDETDFIGAFVESADNFKRPFSFVTDGQVVPSDIRDANAKEMAAMILKLS